MGEYVCGCTQVNEGKLQRFTMDDVVIIKTFTPKVTQVLNQGWETFLKGFS